MTQNQASTRLFFPKVLLYIGFKALQIEYKDWILYSYRDKLSLH
jgi:hypothetical protein